MPREAAYDSFRELGDDGLFELAKSLTDPEVIRRTNLIEFSDLTSVDHRVVTEIRSVGPGGWPGYLPDESSSASCRGFVFLGFLRRGMPAQHTRARMVSGNGSVELTRMDDYSESVTLALLLLDTVWRRCMKSERESIPRPFWLGEKRIDDELPLRGAPPGDIFWQEFLGIRGANLNPDWELFVSRCELAESVKASRLWRDGRSEGDSKWSEERALLAKLCSRLAFSYLSFGWVPGDPREDSYPEGGPFQVVFEFQERILKSQEQEKRVQGLRRRASRTFEESAWASRERRKSIKREEWQPEERNRDRDLRRLADVPETYLGLLDPALDNPDHQARRSRKSERTVSRDAPGGRFAGALALVGVIAWFLVLILTAARLNLGSWPEFVVLGALALGGLALGGWTLYVQRSPGRGLGPSTGPGRKLRTLVAYLSGLAALVGTVAVIGDASLFPFLAVPVLALVVCAATGVFPRLIYWLGALLIALVGLLFLMPAWVDNLAGLLDPLNWGSALGFGEADPDDPPRVLDGLLALGLGAFLLSIDLAFVVSGWRQETVVLPTWSGSYDWNAYEIRTPPEFSVWQGILVRPSRRNRGWRTRTAIEIGRKAHFWWSDPSDRGHVPLRVPDRPELIVLELRARMSGTITILGSALSMVTAAILITVGLTQLGSDGDWSALQGVGGDAVVTLLLVVPTLLGALLIRPGEEPIAGQLLRVDRLLVLVGAVLPAGLAASSVMVFGWPDFPNKPVPGFWGIWILLGAFSVLAGFTLFLSWLDSRKVDRPEPFNRQQGLPVSEPRRRNVDYPAPLPPLESLWGRMFARRSLLRLSPKRSLLRSKVSTTYSLILPAEGSRVYTPAAPTVLCLLKSRARFSDQNSDKQKERWKKLEASLTLIGRRGEPLGTRAALTTNILVWDPAASLSLVAPRYLTTDSFVNDEEEHYLTTLLRLQRANARPSRRKPVGNGGGVVVSTLSGGGSMSGRPFSRGRSPARRLMPRKDFKELLHRGGVDAIYPSVALLGLDTTSTPPQPVLGLPTLAELRQDDPYPSEYQERLSHYRRQIEILDRAALDFDALLLVDPESLNEEQGKMVVWEDRWATGYLSSRAAAAARGTGRGPGAHVWPSSNEPPLAGESLFPFWPSDHGDRTQLNRRILLRDRLRSWSSLRLPRRLLFTRWSRSIPVGVLTNVDKTGGMKPALFRSRAWTDWVRGIPRALDTRPPLPEVPEEYPWIPRDDDQGPAGAPTLKEADPDSFEKVIREYGHNRKEFEDQARSALSRAYMPKRQFKVVLLSGNIASGKSWMMHRIRPRLAEERGEEWDAVRVDSANNFLFSNQDALEGTAIDTRTASYHLDPNLGILALTYQALIQKTFLIEAWDVMSTALGNPPPTQAGVFIEYWPAFSAWVMSAVFLREYDQTQTGQRHPLWEEIVKEIVDASNKWDYVKLPQLPVVTNSGCKFEMVHLVPFDTEELEERVRTRSRRNEEIDPKLLEETQKRLKAFYETAMLGGSGVGTLRSLLGQLQKSVPTQYWILRAAARANGQVNLVDFNDRVLSSYQPGVTPDPKSDQWPDERLVVVNMRPRPEGADLEDVLDRIIRLL